MLKNTHHKTLDTYIKTQDLDKHIYLYPFTFLSISAWIKFI